jgi:drug/metabolite transporter (DMT)-like permease
MHASSSPKQTRHSRIGLIQIHVAVFLFGFAGLLGKSIDAGPAVITLGRTSFAALALLFGLAVTGKSLTIREHKDLSTLCLSGLLLAAHWYAFFQSIQVSSVAVGLLTFSTFPIFVTFMEPFLFGERLEAFDVAISFIVAAGVAMIVPSFDFSNNVTQGIFWGVLSGFTFAVLSLLNRMQVGKYPPLTVTFYQLGFATLFNLPFAVLTGVLPSAKDLCLLLALGVICTALAHALFIASLKHIKARVAGITTGLEPVYGIVFAFLLMGEVPAPRTIIGGLIILAAVFLPVVRSMHDSSRHA